MRMKHQKDLNENKQFHSAKAFPYLWYLLFVTHTHTYTHSYSASLRFLQHCHLATLHLIPCQLRFAFFSPFFSFLAAPCVPGCSASTTCGSPPSGSVWAQASWNTAHQPEASSEAFPPDLEAQREWGLADLLQNIKWMCSMLTELQHDMIDHSSVSAHVFHDPPSQRCFWGGGSSFTFTFFQV